MAVFVASTSFLWIVLWAGQPDDAQSTALEALYRTLSYSLPITAGMWGVSRATRRGSAVPRTMADAMPYARLGKDGQIAGTTKADDRAGNLPTPLAGNDGGDAAH
jgi:hypothetical protein